MSGIKFFESSDFTIESIEKLKGDKKIFVIFSSYGEREADLIYDKLTILKKLHGNIIDRIFLSHRRINADIKESTEERAREAFDRIEILIANSISVPDMGLEGGKGADMRRVLYMINEDYSHTAVSDKIILLFLDSDVGTEYFGVHFVLGLAGGVLSGADFAKASFWRMMGRVKKFVAQPVFSLIDHPQLKKLTDLAYPLSGEVAGTLKFFNSVSFWQKFGVETGINIDACFGDFVIADVNLGLYDHYHHSDAEIQQMSFGIMRTFFLKMLQYGIIELKDNAQIGDFFRASYINENGKRQSMEYDLQEKKYQPIKNIL